MCPYKGMDMNGHSSWVCKSKKQKKQKQKQKQVTQIFINKWVVNWGPPIWLDNAQKREEWISDLCNVHNESPNSYAAWRRLDKKRRVYNMQNSWKYIAIETRLLPRWACRDVKRGKRLKRCLEGNSETVHVVFILILFRWGRLCLQW